MPDLFRPEIAALSAYHTPQYPETDKLDANEVPYDLPEWIKNKLAYLLEQGIRINRYPEGDPLPLKALIAEYCGLTPVMVSVGNGSDELIRSIIIATCAGTNSSILSAEPTFSMYRITAETLGVRYIGLERNADDFSLDLDALANTIRREQVRVVFLANPNSPTANLLSEEALATLQSLPVVVVVDEAYFEFSRFTCAPRLSEWPNLIILRTFSKAFRLASFRVGYALASPQITEILEKVRLPYNLPALSQLAASVALEHRDVLLSVVPEILEERERIGRFLADLPRLRLWPSAANFLYVRSDSDHELHRKLAERGTLIRVTGGGLRITVGTPAENDRLIANLASLLKPGT